MDVDDSDIQPPPPPPPPPPAVQLQELVTALDQAALMAKQLPTATADPSQLLHIHSTLRSAHHRLSLFLSHTPQPQPPPENSLSSAVGGGGGEATPMQMGEDEEEEEVEKVEEKMRECCFIQNKRPKRPLSPSIAVAAEQWRSFEIEAVSKGGGATAAEFERLRSLDLIYQFHA